MNTILELGSSAVWVETEWWTNQMNKARANNGNRGTIATEYLISFALLVQERRKLTWVY